MGTLSMFLEPTIIVGLLIAIFSNYLGKVGDLFVSLIKRLPPKITSYCRVRKWSYSKKVLLSSKNSNQVTYEIVRTFTLLLLFISTIVIYLFLAGSGTFKGLGSLPISVQYFINCPLFIFEILWLLQKDYTKKID